MRSPRKRKVKPWTADEARQFLESAKHDRDPLYAAYVLILVLGLRKGEVNALAWGAVNLDGAELDIGWQLQRVRGQLLRRETKTEASDATLPLPGMCVNALRIREKDQAEARAASAAAWTDIGLVFTTRVGTPYEPRNFNRRFETRCAKAGVRRITVHDTRHTCATLLAALDVHPRVAMRILRHAQIDVTMNVYTEVSDARTPQALKRLGEQLESWALLYFVAVQGRKRPLPAWGVALTWSGWPDLNRRPLRPERSALPSCATPRRPRTESSRSVARG